MDDAKAFTVEKIVEEVVEAKGKIENYKLQESSRPSSIVKGSFRITNIGTEVGVFRDIVNDRTGTAFTLEEGESKDFEFTFRMPIRSDVIVKVQCERRVNTGQYKVDDSQEKAVMLEVPILELGLLGIAGIVSLAAIISVSRKEKGR